MPSTVPCLLMARTLKQIVFLHNEFVNHRLVSLVYCLHLDKVSHCSEETGF